MSPMVQYDYNVVVIVHEMQKSFGTQRMYVLNFMKIPFLRQSYKSSKNPKKIPPADRVSSLSPKKLISSKIPPKSSKLYKTLLQNPPKFKALLECPYCYKRLSMSDNLNRHYGRCKIIQKEKEDDKQEIKELKEMVEKLSIGE